MSSIVFAATVGTALGPVGTIAVGIALSYIDSAFIMPGIFGDGSVDSEGPRIEDLSVQGTVEGSPAKFALGTQVKMAGQVIWATDLNPTRVESDGGGGGGGSGGAGGGSISNTIYSMSVGIRICDTDDLDEEVTEPPDGLGGRISLVRKVWANGKLIYDWNALVFNDAGDAVATTDEDRKDSRYDSLAIYYGNQDQTTGPDATFDPTIDAATSADFWTGSTSEENTTSLRSGEDTSATPLYKGSAYIVINDLQLNDFANRLPNFEFLVEVVNEETTPVTNPPDPGDLPAYHTLADAITRTCLRANMPETDFSVSSVTGNVEGIQSTGDQESARVLEHLMFAGNLIQREDNGVVLFEDRGLQTTTAIDIAEFGAIEFSGGSDVEVPFWREESFDIDLPKRISVSFDDPACNWDRSTRSAAKVNSTNATHRKIDLPMTANEIDVALMAQRSLWAMYGVRDPIEGTLPPSRIDMNPGDLVKTIITDSGGTYTEFVRMEKVSRGLNWEVKFMGRVEEPNIFVQSVVESPRSCIPPDDPFNGNNLFLKMFVTNHMIAPFILNGRRMPDSDKDTFFAAWRDQQGTLPEGRTAMVNHAPNAADLAFERTAQVSDPGHLQWNVQAKMALMTSSLAAAGDENGGLYWDKEASFTMIVNDGESWQPITETEQAVLDGANMIVIQDDDLAASDAPEVLAFKTVVIDSGTPGTGVPVTYTCSCLLRGLRGTQHNALAARSSTQVIAHYPDFVQDHPLKTPGLPRWGQMFSSFSDRTERHWKAVPGGVQEGDIVADREDVIGTLETWAGIIRPYPMNDGRAVRKAGGDFEIFFLRSTRSHHSGMFKVGNYQLEPAPTDSMFFQLDVFDNPLGAGIGLEDPGDTIMGTIQVELPEMSGTGNGDRPAYGYNFPILNQGLTHARLSGFVGFPVTEALWSSGLYTDGDPIKCIAYQMGKTENARGWPSVNQLIPV